MAAKGNEHLAISKCLVRNVASGEDVPIENLWKEKAIGVSLIAVGLEELGVEEFVEGKFFTGDLYVDTNKKCYEVLEFKRYSFLSIFGAVLGSKGRATIAKVRQDHVKGDFRGDGLQNGGTLVISKGGEECLLFYKQEHPGEHIDTSLVYQALGIKVDNPVHTASTAAKI